MWAACLSLQVPVPSDGGDAYRLLLLEAGGGDMYYSHGDVCVYCVPYERRRRKEGWKNFIPWEDTCVSELVEGEGRKLCLCDFSVCLPAQSNITHNCPNCPMIF